MRASALLCQAFSKLNHLCIGAVMARTFRTRASALSQTSSAGMVRMPSPRVSVQNWFVISILTSHCLPVRTVKGTSETVRALGSNVLMVFGLPI